MQACEKTIAEHGDTCPRCGYVYQEKEKIHRRCPPPDTQGMTPAQILAFAAGIATVASALPRFVRLVPVMAVLVLFLSAGAAHAEDMYVVVYTVCDPAPSGITDDMFWRERCRSHVDEITGKPALVDFLKRSAGPFAEETKVYLAKPIKYQVRIKAEERKREVTDTVETGREVIFK